MIEKTINKLAKSVVPEPEGSSPYSQQPVTDLYPEAAESNPHPLNQAKLPKIHFIPTSYPGLGISTGLSSSGFPTKILHPFLCSPTRATNPAPLIPLDLICLMVFGDEYKLWNSPLCNFLHSSITSYLSGPNILLSTMFSNTLSLCSSLNVRN
jgi:hypothetical protein